MTTKAISKSLQQSAAPATTATLPPLPLRNSLMPPKLQNLQGLWERSALETRKPSLLLDRITTTGKDLSRTTRRRWTGITRLQHKDIRALRTISVLCISAVKVCRRIIPERWIGTRKQSKKNAKAYFNIGYLYHFGYSVPHDNSQAMSWCLKAAE